jgi:hypothetical protein
MFVAPSPPDGVNDFEITLTYVMLSLLSFSLFGQADSFVGVKDSTTQGCNLVGISFGQHFVVFVLLRRREFILGVACFRMNND